MAQQIDWKAKERIARKMSYAELQHAIHDCHKAALAVGPNALGKDESYYRDEASIYQKEINRRRAQKGWGKRWKGLKS